MTERAFRACRVACLIHPAILTLTCRQDFFDSLLEGCGVRRIGQRMADKRTENANFVKNSVACTPFHIQPEAICLFAELVSRTLTKQSSEPGRSTPPETVKHCIARLGMSSNIESNCFGRYFRRVGEGAIKSTCTLCRKRLPIKGIQGFIRHCRCCHIPNHCTLGYLFVLCKRFHFLTSAPLTPVIHPASGALGNLC